VDETVNRAARDAFSDTLWAFFASEIDNETFYGSLPAEADDACRAVWDSMWVFFDDLSTHKLNGRHRLTEGEKTEIARWHLFLQTDLPYLWPDMPLAGHDPRLRIRKWFAPLTWIRPVSVSREQANAFLATGDHAYWPFVSAADYQRALTKA